MYVIAENEPQDARLLRPASSGGFGLDAVWNDDYHHAAVVALTGRREAYYRAYKGTAQELVSCMKYGYLYQGQWYSWQRQRRGAAALDLPHSVYVHYLENHDQVANSGFGRRLHQLSAPGLYRAITALTLLGPATPMLFQGQEFASSAPFVYFVDHKTELQEPIRDGRRTFLTQFESLKDPAVDPHLPSPIDEKSFHACMLDFSERTTHAESYALHRDLLALRGQDPVLSAAGGRHVDGAVLAPDAFVLRYFGERRRTTSRRQPGLRSRSLARTRAAAGSPPRVSVAVCLEQRRGAVRRSGRAGAHSRRGVARPRGSRQCSSHRRATTLRPLNDD